jgi:hypothetical protein
MFYLLWAVACAVAAAKVGPLKYYPDYGTYHSVDSFEVDLRRLAADNTDLIHLEESPEPTLKGKHLLFIKLSNHRSTKPKTKVCVCVCVCVCV